ncbi:MAG TPA: lytic transglycosylase domain-containing protein [Pyrinomonadaceae bacterium]|nr:lytic transglycosylase domain-containing protein [Pyrinomonadaceae bacterium]
MTRFPRIALLIFFSCAPVFAQGSGYSFDNFDTANGVRIRVEPAKARKASTRRASKTSLSTMNVDANKAGQALSAPTDNPRPLVAPTVLVYDSLAGASVNSSSALRGYTTGNTQVDQYLINSATNNGVDPLLLYSIMHQESSFKSHAVSPKGARGLMQLMPFTAMRYGVTNIFDPRQNIEGGARYVRFLLDRFDGDITLVLAGYNAGEGAVEKYGWQIPPYSETQEYVRRISRRYAVLRDPNAALYAPRVARMQDKPSAPLTIYERTVSTVRLPDGKLQLMSQ